MTHEYEGGVEVFVILLDVIHIVFVRFLVVNRVEVKSRIVGFCGLEERSKGISETTFPW